MAHMSLTTTAHDPAADTAEWARIVRAGREAKGWTYDEAYFQARTRFPHLRISRGKLVHFEQNKITMSRVDIGALVGIAALYEIPFEKFGPEVEANIAELKQVIAPGSPCTPEPPPGRGYTALVAA